MESATALIVTSQEIYGNFHTPDLSGEIIFVRIRESEPDTAMPSILQACRWGGSGSFRQENATLSFVCSTLHINR
jgi:hypothetical protein